jgi:hypothetical protein
MISQQNGGHMTSGSFQSIQKPLGRRVVELLQSLQIVRDCLGAVREGRDYQLVPLFGQMRALLAEKSADSAPLLVDLATILNQELRLYAFPGVDADGFPRLEVDVALRVGGLPVSYHRIELSQRHLTLDEFLSQKIVEMRGRTFTRAEVIKMLAEKAGGAHYAKKVPVAYEQLTSILINGQSPLTHALFQMADAIYELGCSFVQQLANFHAHFVIAIPEQALTESKVLLEAAYPDSPMRFSLNVDPGLRLRMQMRGIDGREAVVVTQRLIDWSALRHVQLRLEILPNLHSRIEIYVDDELYVQHTIAYPLFMAAEFVQYRRFVNRSVERPDAGLTFGMASMLVVKGIISTREECAIRTFVDSHRVDTAEPLIAFAKDSYGEIAVGETSMVFSGTVTQRTLHDLLAPPSTSSPTETSS